MGKRKIFDFQESFKENYEFPKNIKLPEIAENFLSRLFLTCSNFGDYKALCSCIACSCMRKQNNNVIT